MVPVLTPADRFAFGSWVANVDGVGPFDGPTHTPTDIVHVVEKRAQ